LLIHTNLQNIIDQAEDFPSLSGNIQKILSLAANPDTSLKEVADIIARDASLTTRFLRMLNSAFFGLKNKITSIHTGISLLGIQVVRDVALTLSMLDIFPLGRSRYYTQLFERSITTALMSDFISKMNGQPDTEDIYLAGLLQNLGMFLFVRYLPNEYFKFIEAAWRYHVELDQLEKIHLKINHLETGLMVARRWNLPESVQCSIAARLTGKAPAGMDAYQNVARITFLAGMAADVYYFWNKASRIALFKEKSKELLDLTPDSAVDLLSSVPQIANDGGLADSLQFHALPAFEQIERRAEEEIMQIHEDNIKNYKKLVMLYIKSYKLEKELHTLRSQRAKKES